MGNASGRVNWRWFAALIVCAIVIRTSFAWVQRDRLELDPDAYRQLAETYAVTGVLGFAPQPDEKVKPTAFRPPGYPWLLSWFVQQGTLHAMPVAVLHVCLGTATVGLTFLWMQQVLGRVLPKRTIGSAPVLPFLAGVMVALDPILLVQSGQVMTETLATLLAVLVVFAWSCLWPGPLPCSRRRWLVSTALLGFALSAGYLVRPVSIVWGALLGSCVIALALKRDEGWRSHMTAIGLALLMLGGTVTAWTLRNTRAVGAPIWATTHGGYTLLLANNIPFYEHLQTGWWPGFWHPEQFFQGWEARGGGDLSDHAFWKDIPKPIESGRDEVADDREAGRAAQRTILQAPGTFIHACLVRIGWLWSPLPQLGSSLERSLVGIWYGALYLALTIAIRKHGRTLFEPMWWCSWSLVAALTIVHAVYWSNLRMRAPVMPIVIGIAVMAFVKGKASTPELCNKDGKELAT